MPTERVDLRKRLKALYSASATPVVIDVPVLTCLMVDGHGDPNISPDYAAAVAVLFGISYTLKFRFKRAAEPVDFAVMPLEGLWWADDPQSFVRGDKAKWRWTAMIVQPEFVTPSDVEAAIAKLRDKGPNDMLAKLRLQQWQEGPAAQLLHVGPYTAEGPNIERLHAFIAARGGRLSGRHHEIYLSDPRRTTPERLKTIIRQPFTTQSPG